MTLAKRLFGTTALIGLLGVAGVNGTARADETLTIGFAVSQTGYLAPYDAPTVEGAMMAIDDLNAGGGAAGTYTIEAIVKDVRSDTVQASVAVQELVDDGADVIVVPCDDDPAIAGGLIAQTNGIPVFSTCATNAALPGAIGDYYFTNYVADTLQGATLAEYAYNEGYRSAYILVSPDTTYTNNLPQYFAQTFEQLGGSLLGSGTYGFGQQDFSSEVTKIASLDPQPDVIMTSAYEPDFPAFIKQLRGAGVDAAVLGSDGIDSPTTLALGEVSEGVVFTNAGNPQSSDRLADFFAQYETVYGQPLTNSFAATGYDMVLVIDEAVRQAGSLDGAAMRDAIADIADFQVVTGMISYRDRNHVPARAIALNRVTGGSVEHIDTVVIADDLVPEAIR
jgi:branched-chain amino acid transport system substrate-binding protein